MDILEILGWAVFFYLMFQLVSAWVAMQHIKGVVNEVVEQQLAREEIAKQVTVVRFEHVEQGPYSVILALEKETGKFLGQGNCETEAREMLQNRYPRKRFVIVDEKDTIKATIQPVDAKSA